MNVTRAQGHVTKVRRSPFRSSRQEVLGALANGMSISTSISTPRIRTCRRLQGAADDERVEGDEIAKRRRQRMIRIAVTAAASSGNVNELRRAGA
jgi:hypothetical protein